MVPIDTVTFPPGTIITTWSTVTQMACICFAAGYGSYYAMDKIFENKKVKAFIQKIKNINKGV